MCGICGYISKRKVNDECLTKMNNSLIHRGPDDSGELRFRALNGDYIGLAHRRLAIIDLSSKGHQPMLSNDNKVVIVFNGEIYNFRDLKEQLSHYPYQSKTDTEILLAAYTKWGINFVNKLNGMFAIAIYDFKLNSMFLIRDRLGQKPLYYYLGDTEIVFGSELKVIMNYEQIGLDIDKNVIGRYLTKQYILSPDTIFRRTYKVIPGEIVCFNKGKINKYKYWDINQNYIRNKNNYKYGYVTAKEDLLKTLESAVSTRMYADVPVGILLSGGYDSSIIASIAQKKSNSSIKTYSIGFEDKEYNEAIYAKHISNYLGTDHHELYVSEKEMLEMIKNVSHYYDEPFADSSQIATMLVSKLASKDVKVVLTGDGGDELFAGYPIYHDLKIAQHLDGIGSFINSVLNREGARKKLYNKLPFFVRAIAENRDRNAKTQFNGKYQSELARKMLGTPFVDHFDESIIDESVWSIRRTLLDLQTYLPDDLFCKVDRASMMFSLEARSPFMDINVIEMALSLPFHYKLKGTMGKRILKELAWNLYPRELLDRPKRGFSVPVEKWLKGDLREQLIGLSRKQYLEKQNIFEPFITEQTVDLYLKNKDSMAGRGQKMGSVIWAFYMFQLWYEKYIA